MKVMKRKESHSNYYFISDNGICHKRCKSQEDLQKEGVNIKRQAVNIWYTQLILILRRQNKSNLKIVSQNLYFVDSCANMTIISRVEWKSE